MHYVVLDAALPAVKCAELISRADRTGFEPASVAFPSGAKLVKAIRNNDRIAFTDSSLASELWENLKDTLAGFAIVGRPIGLNPDFRFYRYSKGQRFKPHKDGVVTISKNSATRITALFYLNENFEGGNTILMPIGARPEQALANIVIEPKTGRAFLFEHQTWHEGTAVTSGVKYVLRSDVIFEF